MKKLLSLAVVGVAARWLLDGAQGASRRAMIRERLGGVRGGSSGGLEHAPADAPTGLAGNPDDTRLTDKVASELFRDDSVPKGNVNVNVEFGKVVLRGEVESQEMIDDLVARARDIEGVNDVESLLHLPGQPAPMHE